MCRPRRGTGPQRHFAVTLSPDDVKIPAGAQIPSAAMVGTWSIAFGADRTYSVKHDDVEHVTGTARLSWPTDRRSDRRH
jgi:hypothetical protein